MPLNVAVEQGLGGALATAAIYLGAGLLGLHALVTREKAASRPVLAAALACLSIVIIHGLVEDPFYASRGIALMWAPVGLISATARPPAGDAPASGPRGISPWWWLAPALALLVVLGLFWRPLVAAWHANLGAVAQTATELSAYDYQVRDPSYDEIRRQEDLSAARASFERALDLQPTQPTARTRLAQIDLARGDYEAALDHALTAYEAGHHDRVTRLVLGDALVANGQVRTAAALVEGLERASMRLQGQAHARYWNHQDYRRAADAWQTVLLLEPENDSARQRMEQARARIGE